MNFITHFRSPLLQGGSSSSIMKRFALEQTTPLRQQQLAKSPVSRRKSSTTTTTNNNNGAGNNNNNTAAEHQHHFSMIQRHGAGDKVLTLNVGGKEFLTLRSTIEINPVLRNYIHRAEANQEFTTSNAIFIDRDPKHFGLILQHLRNQADQVQLYRTKNLTPDAIKAKLCVSESVLIPIPKDKDQMRDLFVEARHYQVKELEKLLCYYDFFTRLATFTTGTSGGNPFHKIAQLLQQMRTALLATGGLGMMMTTQNNEFMKEVNLFLADVRNLFRPKEENNDEETKKQLLVVEEAKK